MNQLMFQLKRFQDIIRTCLWCIAKEPREQSSHSIIDNKDIEITIIEKKAKYVLVQRLTSSSIQTTTYYMT